MIKEISTSDLAGRISDGRTALLDVRAVEAYNGWRLRKETRGGHIRTARSLPAHWASYLDWIEIVRAKKIAFDQPVVVYGYESQTGVRIAEQLERAGFADVYVYGDFVREWSARPELPMDELQRHRQLVSPSWLKEMLEEGKAPTFEGDSFVLCHAHYRNPADYGMGHIPGAVALDTNELESSETWNRRSPEELGTALRALGITTKTTVILYGRCSHPRSDDPFPGSSAGHLGAMRCAFILLYAGVEDVRILNGGLQSWVDAGFPLTERPAKPIAAEDFGASIPGRPELAVDLAEAREILLAKDANLVSVRSRPEYLGEVSGYNYIEKKGCIPGAVFVDCGSDAYHMQSYRHLDHTCREYHEIASLWSGVGVTPDKLNAFFCGTGWRGSEAFFNAWLMGWPRVAVYDGGWFEWSRHVDDPLATHGSVREQYSEY